MIHTLVKVPVTVLIDFPASAGQTSPVRLGKIAGLQFVLPAEQPAVYKAGKAGILVIVPY